MAFDRSVFFRAVRASLFGGRLQAKQVAGLIAILNRWGSTEPKTDHRFLAYMLATAHHETGRTMQPVRETFAASDEVAIGRLDRAFRQGKLLSVSVPYWRRDGEGKSWLGRGLVQLTHRANYARMVEMTGIDLLSEPQRAMEMEVAVEILFSGMETGAFTGKRLADYFTVAKSDWSGARRIINGRDRAALVADYARRYLSAIERAANDG
jgi:hypothetical protein